MIDDITRQKYNILKNQLYTIKNKLSTLNEYNEELYSLLKESVLLDNNIFNEELLSSINNEIKEISIELINNIIPLINTKV